MGCSVYAKTIVGIQIDRSVFWRNVGVVYKCERGHTTDKLKFCSECGLTIKEYTKEEPTPAFANFIEDHSSGYSPELVWEDLTDVRKGFLGIHYINSQQHSEKRGDHLAVGISVGETGDAFEYSDTLIGNTIQSLNKDASDVVAFAQDFGLDVKIEDVKVFTCAYVSC